MTKTTVGLGIVTLAVVGLAAGWAWAAGCGGCGGGHARHATATAAKAEQAPAASAAGGCGGCGGKHAGHATPTVAKAEKAPAASPAHHLQALEDRLTAALAAAESGDAKAAAAELAKAKHLLGALKAQIADVPANDRCPIMGGKVNPKLTRSFEGKTVGFCCAGCFPKWDNLSDAEKKAKLGAQAAH